MGHRQDVVIVVMVKGVQIHQWGLEYGYADANHGWRLWDAKGYWYQPKRGMGGWVVSILHNWTVSLVSAITPFRGGNMDERSHARLAWLLRHQQSQRDRMVGSRQARNLGVCFPAL